MSEIIHQKPRKRGRQMGQFAPNAFRIEGDRAYVALNGKAGKVEAVVDAADLERTLGFGRWFYNAYPSGKLYVVARVRVDGHRKSLSLHRFLMDAPAGSDMDHINGKPLDCRRANMRITSRSQNAQNRGPGPNSTSGVKNVAWDKHSGKWQVRVTVGRQMHFGGSFKDLGKAVEVASALRRQLHTHCPENSMGAQ